MKQVKVKRSEIITRANIKPKESEENYNDVIQSRV